MRTLILMSLCSLCMFFGSLVKAQQFSTRGPGGGGALFSPSFQPAHPGEISLACDMGESFVTRDYGKHWSSRHFRQLQCNNNHGTVQYTKDTSLCYSIDATSIGGYDTYRPTKSTDGGRTWQVLKNDPTVAGAYYLFASYAFPTHLLVADYYNVFWSTDGGDSWTKIYSTSYGSGLVVAGAAFLEPDIFIGLDKGVLYSSDAGSTFQMRTDIGGLDTTSQAIFSFCAGRTEGIRTTYTLYASVQARGDVWGGVTALDRPAFDGIYTTTWDAKKWVKSTSSLPSSYQPFFVACASDKQFVCYAAGASTNSVPIVLKTTDAGGTWNSVFQTSTNQNIATGWSGDGGDRAWSYGELVLGLAVNPADDNEVVISDLGFAHCSRDGGQSWHQCYCAQSNEHPAGSTTPKGAAYSSIGLENTSCWQLVWLDSLNVYGCYSDIQGTRSTDGGKTWGFHYTGHNDNSLYYVVKDVASGNCYGATSSVHDMYQSTYLQDARIDAGRGKVLFSTNNGADWQTMHDFTHPVIWLALDPAHPNRMYASVIHSTQGGVYECDNIQAGAASTWQKLPTPTRTEGHPFCLRVLNDGTLIATYSGRRNASGFTQSSGVFVWNGTAWADRSDEGMKYWTKDIVVDPNDASQNTWYTCVFSGWGGAPNGKGGLYRTTNRGQSWTKINTQDRVTSLSFNPQNPHQAYMTTETEGLWVFDDITVLSPTATQVNAYDFRQPERVFFNPYIPSEMWVSSFGHGLVCSSPASTQLTPPTLVAPQTAQTLVSRRIDFLWQSDWSPVDYRFQLSADSLFQNPVADLHRQSEHYVHFVRDWGNYYWRVKAYSATDSSDWSTSWLVRAPQTIDPDSTLSPTCMADSVTIPVNLSWARNPSETHARLVIARDAQLNTIVVDTLLPNFQQNFVWSDALPWTTYHWCIFNVAKDLGGESSDTCSFTTKDLSQGVGDDQAGSIAIYPQPVHGTLHVMFNNTARSQTTIQLFTIDGSLLLNRITESSATTNGMIIDCSSFAPGVYILQISTTVGARFYRVVIY